MASAGSSGDGARLHVTSGMAHGLISRVVRRRVVRYQGRAGGPYIEFSPFGRGRNCACRDTYAYLDTVVLSIDAERRRLGREMERLVEQLGEARAAMAGHVRALQEMEGRLRDEEERTDVLRCQLRDTHQHLFALRRQMRERALGMMAECELMMDMAAEAPPRAVGATSADDRDSQDSVGDEP